MQTMELIAPCHFGMESVLKREIYDLGYDITSVDNGRVTFAGDAEAVARANIGLRSAERILLKAGEFKAASFDDLFEGTKAIPWADYLPADARFWVTKAASVRTRLFSPSDIQSIMKKAMVDSMAGHYRVSVFPEDGASYPVRVMIKDDIVTVALDTTGESLHKRGYRKYAVKAPIAENLAASLLMLTPWSAERILVDPFCGSGTFPIEAALMSANIAPGLYRSFTAETWNGLIPASVWKDIREEASEAADPDIETDIQGYDIDPAAIEAARNNARLAGVDKLIHFQVRDVSRLSHHGKYGFLIANPPYGERLLKDDPEIWQLYAALGERFKALDSWSMYLISAYEQTEAALGIKAAKNRKIYNGMLRSYFYQFPGPKPAGRRKERS
ncbi:MAG: class I SAM-dependent RNA methyltransferase [Lachnospiraceae bacterium]|nr:class I SAM-dependent RNA methyltransferase [Lachnospiraceae bacterium]